MINGKKILAIIPARGGSKGVPRKNIRELEGRPLIAWTILATQKSKYVDHLILSSDDEEIIQVAKFWGCDVPFIRPKYLAQDDTPGILSVLHALDNINESYDLVMLLQPTSPFRTSEDIDGCLEFLEIHKAGACVSITKASEHPFWMYNLTTAGFLQPLVKKNEELFCRQDLPDVYVLNGAVYAADTHWLKKNKTFLTEETIGFVMPQERSIDIDTEIDLEVCSHLLKQKDAIK